MAKENNSVLVPLIQDEVRKKFGREVLYTTDCLILSEEILAKTKRRLSVSTLKRFFGVVISSHTPSRFTIDTLLIYLQLEKEPEIIRYAEGKGRIELHPWLKIKKLTDEITQTSLNSIKNKIGPGYKNLPLRRFAEKKMEDFLNSPKTATAFIAPDGRGKSTILTQITEEFFTGTEARYPDDLVCLIDGNIFHNLLTDKRYFKGLSNLVEYNPANAFNLVFLEKPELVKGNLALIIEGIDDIFFVNGNVDKFIINLLNIIQSYGKLKWFKMVISCSPAIWKRISDRMQKKQMLKSLWFDVTFFGTDADSDNIPLLSNKEIKAVLRQNQFAKSMTDLRFIHPDIMDIINHPSLLNIFCTNYQHAGRIQDIDLLTNYVQLTVLSPPCQEEKFAIIKLFFALCDKGKTGTEVYKEELNLSASGNLAYFELMRTGIFQEYSFVDKYLVLNTKVRFSSPVLFSFYLANILVKENQQIDCLLRDIFSGYSQSPLLQCTILKYVLKILFREEKTGLLKNIFSVIDDEGLMAELFAQNDLFTILINVVGLEMRKNEKLRIILLPYFARSTAGRRLYFEQFFDFDSLVLFSGNNLSFYLNNNLTEGSVQYVRYLKFMQYFLGGNHELCRAEYEKILTQKFKQVNNSLKASWYFIPQLVYQSVYTNRIDEALIRDIYALSDTFLKLGTQSRNDLPQLEFAAVFSLAYGKMSNEIISLSDYIFENYDLTNLKSVCIYQLFLAVYARALLEAGELEKAFEIYRQVEFKNGNIPEHMKYFVKIRLLLIQAEFLIHLGKTGMARRKLGKIVILSRMLKFSCFEDTALALERSIVQVS